MDDALGLDESVVYLPSSDLTYISRSCCCGVGFLLGGLVFLAGRLGVRYHWGCLFLVLDFGRMADLVYILSYCMFKCTFNWLFILLLSALVHLVRSIAADPALIIAFYFTSFRSPCSAHSLSAATANCFFSWSMPYLRFSGFHRSNGTLLTIRWCWCCS